MQEKFISQGSNVTGDEELAKLLSEMDCKKMYNTYLMSDKLIVNEFLNSSISDYIGYDYVPNQDKDGNIYFDLEASFYEINNRKMMMYYNLEETDIFKKYRGVGSEPYIVGRDKDYNIKLVQYNPVDVQYYRSDDSSAFNEYNEIFGIDIDVSFNPSYMIKKYNYDKSILVKNENGELVASFEYDRVKDYSVLLADFPMDQYMIIFEKDGDLPTISHKIEYTIDTKVRNIFKRKRPITINDIPVIEGNYDEYGYPSSAFVNTLENGAIMYRMKNTIPFNIRDCMYTEPTICVDVVTIVKGATIIVRYILPDIDDVKTSN